MNSKPRKTGTREWSEHSLNIFKGCAHNCRYCYARASQLKFGQLASAREWPNMQLNEKKLNEKPKKLAGRIMFPTTHDLLPEHLRYLPAFHSEVARRWE